MKSTKTSFISGILLIPAIAALGLSACSKGEKATAGAGMDHMHGGHQMQMAAPSPPDAESAALAVINKAEPPGPAPEGMVWIPGGTFWQGCAECEMPDALPVHLVKLDGYWMDKTVVTNAQFAKFVAATNYQTIAERKPKASDYPGAKPEQLVPGSAVFSPPIGDVSLDNPFMWWKYQAGANWKHPEGPGSDLKGKENHPVVHIAWVDAVAYAKWAGKRLPTEAEYEFAARGGHDRNRFSWGNDMKPDGKWAANIFQGKFPNNNTGEDGYLGTSPVTAFPANGFGLYDMGGNVWQWCADWYRPDYYEKLPAKTATVNPLGPEDSFDPDEPGIPKRVQKGGSYLCSDQYCARYQVGSRGKGAPDSGGTNVGFRLVKSR